MTPVSTSWLADAARARPGRVALRDGSGAELTYGRLLDEAGRLARSMEAEAPAKGLVTLELMPGLDHGVALHAAMIAGRPVQTIRPDLPAAERARLRDEAAPALAVDREWLDGRRGRGPAAAPSPPDPQQTLCRVMSSGTTGPQRPIELSFANHHASALASAANLGVDPEDRWLCCLPLDHVAGLAIPIRSAIYRTAALVHERFDVGAVSEAVSGGVTILSLVPTQLRRLLEHGVDMSKPRIVLVGGGPLGRETLDEALSRGVPVVQTYGLTEACSQVCTLPPGELRRKRGSVGKPLPGVEVRIGVEEGVGEVLVRGPVVARDALADDGWLHTGDLGRFDDEGYLWLEGRIDELIVTGGENVRPERVEESLLSHPAVAEAAAFGRPDPEWGQSVNAAVVPAEGTAPDPEELRRHCRERLVPYEVPKSISLLDALPRTPSGKLQRRRLAGGDGRPGHHGV